MLLTYGRAHIKRVKCIASLLNTHKFCKPTLGQKYVLEFEFIGVLRQKQRYFSHICNGTDVQED